MPPLNHYSHQDRRCRPAGPDIHRSRHHTPRRIHDHSLRRRSRPDRRRRPVPGPAWCRISPGRRSPGLTPQCSTSPPGCPPSREVERCNSWVRAIARAARSCATCGKRKCPDMVGVTTSTARRKEVTPQTSPPAPALGPRSGLIEPSSSIPRNETGMRARGGLPTLQCRLGTGRAFQLSRAAPDGRCCAVEFAEGAELVPVERLPTAIDGTLKALVAENVDGQEENPGRSGLTSPSTRIAAARRHPGPASNMPTPGRPLLDGGLPAWDGRRTG
jgi:hypothetical protein